MIVSRRKPWIAVVLVGATLFLAVLGYRASEVASTADYHRTVAQLREGRFAESQINETLLEIRQGFLNNYDPLVEWMSKYREIVTALVHDPVLRGQMSASGALSDAQALEQAVLEKEEDIERFKRHFAVWRNSARYLPVIAVDLMSGSPDSLSPGLHELLNRLLREVLLHNSLPTPESATRVRVLLASLDNENRGIPQPLRGQIDILTKHVNTILKEKRIIDTLTKGILSASTQSADIDLLDSYEAWYRQQTRVFSHYQYALYALSLVLAAYLVYLFLVLTQTTVWLRRSLHALSREKLALDQHAIVSICDLNGIVASVNDKFCAISGCSRDALLGQPHRHLKSQHHTDPQQIELWRTVLRGEVFHGEICNRREDGSLYWLATTVMPFTDEDGEIEHLVEIATDVSDRQRAQEEVRRLNAELETKVQHRTKQLAEANKDLESFSYSVSHDLRAPLRAVHGFATAMSEDCGDSINQECRDHLNRIRAASDKMGHLIDDLLKLSRVTRGDLNIVNVNLCELARNTVSALRKADPRRQVDVEYPADCTVRGDSRLLAILLDNLIGNAWKFTRKREHAHIALHREAGNGVVVISVADNGAGFDMAYTDKLFNPFQRLHAAQEFEGTGIGLSIVKRIVLRHGGRVWAKAEEGIGATFYVEFPESVVN